MSDVPESTAVMEPEEVESDQHPASLDTHSYESSEPPESVVLVPLRQPEFGTHPASPDTHHESSGSPEFPEEVALAPLREAESATHPASADTQSHESSEFLKGVALAPPEEPESDRHPLSSDAYSHEFSRPLGGLASEQLREPESDNHPVSSDIYLHESSEPPGGVALTPLEEPESDGYQAFTGTHPNESSKQAGSLTLVSPREEPDYHLASFDTHSQESPKLGRSPSPANPYATAPVTLRLGDTFYTIPEYFLRPYSHLRYDPHGKTGTYEDPHTGCRISYHAWLKAHPFGARTIVHYLYTGEYLAIDCPPLEGGATTAAEQSRIYLEDEFLRAAFTYTDAARFEISGLMKIAGTQLEEVGRRVSLLLVLNIARATYLMDSLEKDDGWYKGYLKRRLMVEFAKNRRSFREVFWKYGVGLNARLDKFLMDEVLRLYELADAKANANEPAEESSGARETMGCDGEGEAVV
ncbi:uncharacterized protein BO97DRAFT_451961 [Aspergillus homomorphus CBS 101889]|uniref:BTB domain-containing protein n=1 Tax=Aspergillus homomorphus (strain CBS 101889) TaxID=1450537 RepID=A0A395HYV0_ASPHC|nr:hypothetical protein BO97DRAFT_451961 [Aspergillus homomorphus CBS 101889]RAL12563.1 hypothetical protein BO97DRAFT_451961 [Aspergillus homomorphus CBS 101889]